MADDQPRQLELDGLLVEVQAEEFDGFTNRPYVALRLRMAAADEGSLEVAYQRRLDDIDVDDLIDALAAARDETRRRATELGWDPDADDDGEFVVVSAHD